MCLASVFFIVWFLLYAVLVSLLFYEDFCIYISPAVRFCQVCYDYLTNFRVKLFLPFIFIVIVLWYCFPFYKSRQLDDTLYAIYVQSVIQSGTTGCWCCCCCCWFLLLFKVSEDVHWLVGRTQWHHNCKPRYRRATRIALSSLSLLNNTTSTCFRINCPLVCHIEYKVQFYLCFANIGQQQQQQYYGQLLQTNTTFIYTRPQSYHSYVHSSRGAIINLMRALANQQRLALLYVLGAL